MPERGFYDAQAMRLVQSYFSANLLYLAIYLCRSFVADSHYCKALDSLPRRLGTLPQSQCIVHGFPRVPRFVPSYPRIHPWHLLLAAAIIMNRSLTCTCGRSFAQHNALSNHQRYCQKSKRRLSGALNKFKDLVDSRKRRRVDAGNSDLSGSLPVNAVMMTESQPERLNLRTVIIKIMNTVAH